jgi:hypothetical protein
MNTHTQVSTGKTALVKRLRPLHAITLTLSVLALVACASTPKAPTQAIQAAEQAIATADQARVVEFASAELTEAREKLSAAKHAVEDKKMVLAERLANESRADADLAVAKGEAAKAAVVNDDMRKSTHVLKQEMNRKTGDSQ